jgi:hypothetical protein
MSRTKEEERRWKSCPNQEEKKRESKPSKSNKC